MKELVIAILLVACFNTSMSLINNKKALGYSVPIYWILVMAYWFLRI